MGGRGGWDRNVGFSAAWADDPDSTYVTDPTSKSEVTYDSVLTCDFVSDYSDHVYLDDY